VSTTYFLPREIRRRVSAPLHNMYFELRGLGCTISLWSWQDGRWVELLTIDNVVDAWDTLVQILEDEKAESQEEEQETVGPID
jgi:hypothetical protein